MSQVDIRLLEHLFGNCKLIRRSVTAVTERRVYWQMFIGDQAVQAVF
jgi:hypothetical protein